MLTRGALALVTGRAGDVRLAHHARAQKVLSVDTATRTLPEQVTDQFSTVLFGHGESSISREQIPDLFSSPVNRLDPADEATTETQSEAAAR